MIYIFYKGINYGRYYNNTELHWKKLFAEAFVLQELKLDGSKWKIV